MHVLVQAHVGQAHVGHVQWALAAPCEGLAGSPPPPPSARRYAHAMTREDPQPAAYLLWVAPGASITLPLGASNTSLTRSLTG